MMDGGIKTMMAWMMGLGLAGWVLIIALLVTIAILLVRLLGLQKRPGDQTNSGGDHSSPGQVQR